MSVFRLQIVSIWTIHLKIKNLCVSYIKSAFYMYDTEIEIKNFRNRLMIPQSPRSRKNPKKGNTSCSAIINFFWKRGYQKNKKNITTMIFFWNWNMDCNRENKFKYTIEIDFFISPPCVVVSVKPTLWSIRQSNNTFFRVFARNNISCRKRNKIFAAIIFERTHFKTNTVYMLLYWHAMKITIESTCFPAEVCLPIVM